MYHSIADENRFVKTFVCLLTPFVFLLTLLMSLHSVAAPDETIDLSSIQPPGLKSPIVALYPEQLLQGNTAITGTVLLLVTIDKKGQVAYSEALETTNSEFVPAAMRAVSEAEFSPARDANGAPIIVSIEIEIAFTPPVRVVLADASSITGRLVSRGNKTPVAAANISVVGVENPPASVFSNNEGEFQIEGLPATTVTLRILAPDFEVLTVVETLAKAERLSVEYYLEPAVYSNLRIVVEGQRERREISRQTVSTLELVNIPGTGQDAIKVVQVLPGVAVPSDLSGSLLIRGSSDRDNFVEIDDMPVPFVFHLFSISSVLSSFLIDSIDLYPSNFSARYGDAIGGAFIIETRDPAEDVWRGSVNVGTLLAEAYAEGPIGKKFSLLVSARRSYFDAILKAAIPDNVGFSLVTAPQFADYQLRLAYRPVRGHKITMLLNGAQDTLRLLLDKEQLVDPEQFQDFSFEQGFHQLRFRHTYNRGGVFRNRAMVGLGTQNTKSTVDSDDIYFNLFIDLIRLRNETTIVPITDTTINVGFKFDFLRDRADILLPSPPRRGQYDYDFVTAERQLSKTTGKRKNYAGYAEIVQKISTVTARAGVYATTQDNTPYTLFDPRGQISWEVIDGTILKAAAGVYHQFPEPQNFIPEAGGNPTNSPPGAERSFHYLLGFEQSLPWELRFLVEGYYKDMDKLLQQTNDFNDPLRFRNNGKGRAYGVELTLRKPFTKRVFGWLNYSYSRTERYDPQLSVWSVGEFDQPHILNAVVSYMVTKAWRMGARYRYSTGNPVASTHRAIYYADLQTYLEAQTRTRDRRLDSYQRLDIRGDYTWLLKKWKLSTYMEVLNVYLHDNPLGENAAYDFSARETINSFPILLNFGVKADF